jgi:hypothetical protein
LKILPCPPTNVIVRGVNQPRSSAQRGSELSQATQQISSNTHIQPKNKKQDQNDEINQTKRPKHTVNIMNYFLSEDIRKWQRK